MIRSAGQGPAPSPRPRARVPLGKAGVTCIGLLSGGIGRSELTKAGAAQIYPDPGELLAAFDTSPLAR